VLKINVSRAWT